MPTLVVICTIRDPVTGESYSRDARHIAQKAEAYLKGTGVGDTAYFGPELEHFVFDGVRYDQGTNYGFYEIKSHEANWDAGEGNGPSARVARAAPQRNVPDTSRGYAPGCAHRNGAGAREARYSG